MKIGVFDSGFGGLSVLTKVVQRLGRYDYVYLGDSARAPYGVRTPEEVVAYTEQAVDFFDAEGCSLVILACNTASAVALRRVQQHYLPQRHPDMKVLGVLIPAAEVAASATRNHHIGVMATPTTVASRSFVDEVQKVSPQARVTQVACPRLVPLIEAGVRDDELNEAVASYCQVLHAQADDVVILGCTHYELIQEIIEQQLDATIVSEGEVVAQKLQSYLERHAEIAQGLARQGTRSYYTTGDAAHFNRHARQMVGIECDARQIVLG